MSDSVCDRTSVQSSTWGCQCFHRNYFVSPPVCFWRTSMILGVQKPTLSTGQPYTYCTPVTSSCVRLSFSPPPSLLPPPPSLLSYFFHSLVYWLSAVASPFLGIMVDKLGFNLFFRESCFMGEKFRFGESGPSSPHAPSPPHPYPHTLIPTSSPPHSHLTH